MKAIQVDHYLKSPHELKVAEVPDPVPKENEYLIRVHAAAANFFDILQAQGRYQHQPPLPWIAGFEFSGTVISTPSSGKYPPGTRVFGASQGAFATLVTAPPHLLLPVPSGWDFSSAAGLFLTASTSYAALTLRSSSSIQRGTTVLVHAAAGGVGLAAVQIAKAQGATVIATAGGQRKGEVARQFGADHVVDYTAAAAAAADAADNDWPEQVKKLTPGGRGVDVVFDPVGLVDKSTRCTAWSGRILVIGFAGGAPEKIAMNKVLLKNISLVGLHWGEYAKRDAAAVPGVWRGLLGLIADGRFRSTEFMDREFVGLESVPAALTALGSRETWGKVVIKIPQEGGSRL